MGVARRWGSWPPTSACYDRRVNFRIFVAWPDGDIQFAEAPDGVEDAVDIMMADRVPEETAAKMAMACAKDGRDPVAWAEHFVKLRKYYRTIKDQ